MRDVSNYYEQLVTDRLWKIIESSDEPLSQTFLDDVVCLALNSLPPCYVRNTIDKGIHLSEHDYLTMENAVDAAIQYAMQQVRQQPHEDRDR